MGTARQMLIAAGLAAFRTTGLHRLVPRSARGCGAILAFHHVRPSSAREFAPNRGLEITPDFLDAVLTRVKALGYDIVALDSVPERLRRPRREPFVALTFDDGYRDNLVHALPVLERDAALFTMYVTTGFADRSARLWWLELEEALRAAGEIEVDLGAGLRRFPLENGREKQAAFQTIYWALRARSDEVLLDTIARLSQSVASARGPELVADLCLGWDEIARVAAHPLATIGCHTLTHPRLALHPEGEAQRELRDAKRVLEARLGRVVRHLAYPVGDPVSAGAREFALARACGFKTAVTTRPGVLFPSHAAHLTALPRLSVNGLWQDLGTLDVLLSGAAFAFWNRGRVINVT